MHAPFRHLSEADIVRIEEYLRAEDHVRWLMARAPHDGRPPMVVRTASTVNAQSVRATDRPRIADSFDARPAKDRAKGRPYSARQQARDVAYSMRPRLTWEARSIRIVPIDRSTSIGALNLEDEIRAAEDRGATWEPFSAPRADKGRRKVAQKSRPLSAREERAARLRAVVGTIRMGEQD